MVQVTELGYLTLGVSNLEQWKAFAGDILGLEVVAGDKSNRAYLRMDYWHHRITLEEDGSDDLKVLGFRVAGPDEFGEMAKRLEAAGVAVKRGSFDEAYERHVLEVMTLQDPSGYPIEIFHGPHVQANHAFLSGAAHAWPVQDRNRRARPRHADATGRGWTRPMSSIGFWVCGAASNIACRFRDCLGRTT